MAIQVGGTTVIDDSRNLTNVGGLKTINSTSILGSGDITITANPSTTYGAVGTYLFGSIYSSTIVADGSTYAGSDILPAGGHHGNTTLGDDAVGAANLTKGSTALSGTWRAMGRSASASGTLRGRYTLFVRIS